MFLSRRWFKVVLTILTIVSVVGLIVAPADAGVGPNPPGATAPGIQPDLNYEIPPKPYYEFVEGVAVLEGDPGDVTTMTFELVSTHPIAYDKVFHAETYHSEFDPNAATPWVDYIPTNAPVIIAAGETSATFDVQILGDLLHEGDETVRILVYEQGSNVAMADVYGVIIDDDPDVKYALADAQVYEGGPRGLTFLTFALTASEPLDYDVTFLATTQSGTATPGEDYVALSYVPVVLPAGQTAAAVQVQVIGDTVVEDDETLTLQLYRLDAGNTWHLLQATGTILDDDLQRASAVRWS